MLEQMAVSLFRKGKPADLFSPMARNQTIGERFFFSMHP